MTLYAIWRLVKFLAMALFAAGAAAPLAQHPAARARLGLGVMTLGWMGTWLAGWGLTKSTGLSMSEPWIGWGMMFSLVSLAGAAAGASGTHRLWAALSLGGLGSTICVMSLKGTPSALLISVMVGTCIGALASVIAPTPQQHSTSHLWTWFRVMAGLEALTVLALFCLYLPAKMLFDIKLDGGQGWFGWAHGMMVMGYLIALLITGLRLGWSLFDGALGALASFVPFGTIWFEHRMKTKHQE